MSSFSNSGTYTLIDDEDEMIFFSVKKWKEAFEIVRERFWSNGQFRHVLVVVTDKRLNKWKVFTPKALWATTQKNIPRLDKHIAKKHTS